MLTRGRAAHEPALERLAAAFAWPRVAEPLVRFASLGRAPAAPTRLRCAGGRAQVARGLAYRAGRNSLNAVGLKDWPTLY